MIESQGGTAPGEPEQLNARRISIVGATGSGKSVLARRLAEAWHLPLYELDTVYWQRGGLPADEFTAAISDIVAREEWVLDGHYRAVRTMIWRRATMVIWLNYPFWLVGLRLLRRYLEKRRSHSRRPRHQTVRSMQHSEVGRASWGGRLGRLARTIRERGEYGRLLGGPEFRHVAVLEFKSPAKMERWLREMSGEAD